MIEAFAIASPFLIALAFLLGRWTAPRNAVRERKANGSVSRDFAWPGKPMRIFDAEVLTPDTIDAAVRGD